MRKTVNQFFMIALAAGWGIVWVGGSAIAQTRESSPPATPDFRGGCLIGGAERIDKLLRQATSADYEASPMSDVLDQLSVDHQVTILIHDSARDFGFDEDCTVTIKVYGMPLVLLLENILEPYDCTVTVHNDVLKVISNDRAPEMPEQRVYNCSALLEKLQSGDPESNLGRLTEILTATLDPDSWEVNGGSGLIAELEGRLVISQTLRNHLAIEQLLATLDRKFPR